MGARQAGLGYSSATLQDEWAIYNNIGGLGSLKESSVLFAYDAKTSIKGANRMAAGFILPVSIGNAAVALFRFGDQLYSEQIISAGYGNQFGNTSLGVKLNYIQYRTDVTGTKSGFSIDFGGVTQITPQLFIGAYLTNLTQSSLNTSDNEPLPTILIAGIGFRPDKNILISTEIEKDLDYKPTWKTGFEYQVYKKISFRTGYSLYPSALFFGTGFQKKNIRFDYAVKLAQIVGTAHQASATFVIAKREQR